MKRTVYPIHPDFKKYEKFNPPLNPIILPIMQKFMSFLIDQEKSDHEINVIKLSIPVDNGEIKALLYSPVSITENASCLVYYHGGGFVLPAAPSHFHWAKEYAKRVGCKVLFVDYRLAPKHPFPIPSEDSFKAYTWLLEHAHEYSIDINRIAVGGDSAGGELATVVCLMAMDHSIKIPCTQMLIYPVTAHKLETQSVKDFVDTPLCNSRDLEKYQNYYAKNEKAGKWEYLSPLDSDKLNRMPPTYIETAEFDCLRDCGILYANKLSSLGVVTVLNQTKGTIHGYDINLESDIVKESINHRVKFLQSYLRD
ncbi:MAG: alpha/beta hydrolase [Erysipelotrichaceae bacterium]